MLNAKVHKKSRINVIFNRNRKLHLNKVPAMQARKTKRMTGQIINPNRNHGRSRALSPNTK
jgi:hypothetical protein